MSSRKKVSKRYAGYLLVIALYLAWFRLGFNPGVIAALSGATFLYALFAAPVPCCAENRDGTFCRDNGKGLLLGCWRYQHKWQNAKMLVRRQSWARFGSRIFGSISGNAAALAAIAGFASAAATLIVPLFS